MHSYIIGLDQGYRGGDLEAQISAMGGSFERVPGVLVAELPGSPSDYVDQAASSVLLRRTMTVGEIGCALAHRAAYERFLRTDSSFAAVYEDDARIVVPYDLEKFKAHLEVDTPTVLLMYSWTMGLVARREVSRPGEGVVLWESSTTPLTATAYILNRAAANTLLEDGRLVSSVADWPALPASRMRFLFSYPWMAKSDVEATSTLNEVRISREPIDQGSKGTKIVRHLKALLHITWLARGSAYGDYRSYRYHEFDRLIRFWMASKRNRHIVEGDPNSPIYAFGWRSGH